MGVGFLHGVLPQGLTRSFFISPQKIEIVTTDEILFPVEIRRQLEEEFHVKFTVTVTRDWDALIAKTVATPSADLIFLPSYWAKTLAQQNLLADISGPGKGLQLRVASDFAPHNEGDFFSFLPFYWIKTQLHIPQGKSFQDFLKDKSMQMLLLIADEDLLLRHFQNWKNQGLWEQVSQKKLLTLQLDQLTQPKYTDDTAMEVPVVDDKNENSDPLTSSLLIWGAAIPVNSEQKDLALEILDTLTTPEHQERSLLKTPFNSTFSMVTGNEIPLHRRASLIRNLQLKDTLRLDGKDQDSREKLKNIFNFSL